MSGVRFISTRGAASRADRVGTPVRGVDTATSDRLDTGKETAAPSQSRPF